MLVQGRLLLRTEAMSNILGEALNRLRLEWAIKPPPSIHHLHVRSNRNGIREL